MVKIDLITGFLGSGKTTFIKEYARYLMRQGLNIGILENDYGAINVDMMLLQDLEGEKCELEMIAGGCDADCHRRRFRTKLIAMGMCGYDRVIVEPSGIYDVDEFFDALREDPLDQWYEIGNVITIVDAKLEKDLSETADYLLASEAANAGCILLSHADEADPVQMDETIAHLNAAMEGIQCKRRFSEEVIRKSVLQFVDKDFEKIANCGYRIESYEKRFVDDSGEFSSLYYMNKAFDRDRLEVLVKQIFADVSCGRVFRIKGFFLDQDKNWVELNATKDQIRFAPIGAGQDVVIVIGQDLVEENIDKYLS